jgi:hypothetical protein
MKARIEEAAKEYIKKSFEFETLKRITMTDYSQCFIAGAEFVQGEVKDLEYQLEQQKIMNPISVDMVATISDLSEKLKVAVEALNESYEMIRSTSYTVDNNTGNRVMDGNEYIWIDRGIIVMKEALEKLKV